MGMQALTVSWLSVIVPVLSEQSTDIEAASSEAFSLRMDRMSHRTHTGHTPTDEDATRDELKRPDGHGDGEHDG